MAEITFTITIPDDKNTNDEALNRFVRVFPNNTADPGHIDFIPPRGLNDEDWMAERTRRWVNDIVNRGATEETREAHPPPVDDEVVERPPVRP